MASATPPAWLEGLHWKGLYARGRRWDVRVHRGDILVGESSDEPVLSELR